MTLPQNRLDERLHAALRSLAQGSQTGASGETGDALVGAFRRHHARRKARRGITTAAVFIILTLPAVLLLRSNHGRRTSGGNNEVTAKVQPEPASNTPTVVPATMPQRVQKGVARKAASGQVPLKFVALPAYMESTNTEDARIIRLKLSGRALRMVGAPVNPEDEGRQVLADFVVGQDGTPYAVRLVH